MYVLGLKFKYSDDSINGASLAIAPALTDIVLCIGYVKLTEGTSSYYVPGY